ncbi:MAG TPA: diguanylate cyclase [Gaiellaceae bacterium]|jgi:diguanylate cyclase (GGDEF)-like protein|nr:diguanylate cyclase [Gaiellaceae bacterium]
MRRLDDILSPRLFGILLASLLGVYALIAGLGLSEHSLGGAISVPLYTALEIGAALFCLARPIVNPHNRLAWIAVGLGILSFAVGDIYFSFWLAKLDSPPYPSFADAGYIGLYPLIYLGLGLLLRNRTLEANRSFWLDGTIAGLTVAALGAALLFNTIVDTTGGDFWTIVTNLSYPLGDLGLLVIVLSTLGLTGWQIDRVWGCMLVGCAIFAVTDTAYLYQTAVGTYEQSTILDAGWPAGLLLFAFGAWQTPRTMVHRRLEGFRVLAVPVGFGLLGLGLLVYDHFHRLNHAALLFSTAAIGAVIGRMALTFRENTKLLKQSRRDAETDALTGLANRRKLLLDLEERLAAQVPTLLILFDLDGFKSYNDAFGHPAGDALLRRLAQKLDAACRQFGRSYRMGGDEFCVLAHGDPSQRASIVATATKALEDAGEGFKITCAYGAIVVPEETSELSEALRIADTRMYGNKDSRRASAVRQSKDVLLSVLSERDAELRGHLTGVAQLARAVGARLELPLHELHDLALAAELHDVGKLAIPDAILQKPGALTDEERSFVHRHTLVGERILCAAPSLERIARLVRSTHERLDGLGYPDGLSGDTIPLLSRIIAACDAFFAMTEERPYRRAMTSEDAISELRRCAGTQFDPVVVEALISAYIDAGLELVA